MTNAHTRARAHIIQRGPGLGFRSEADRKGRPSLALPVSAAGLRPGLLLCRSSNPGPRHSPAGPGSRSLQPATGVETGLCLVTLLARMFLGRWRGFRDRGWGAGRHLPAQPQ